jgi:hypothetical protein
MRALVLLALLSSCSPSLDDDLYERCEDVPTLQLRDPQTGACTMIGYLGPDCAACGSCVPDPFVDPMGRAVCGASCEGRDEPSCLAATCRAVYALDDGRFLACWTPSSRFSSTGTCAGLDAYACSYDVTCSSWYVASGGGPMTFDHCGDRPPPAACAWADCHEIGHCVQDCTGDCHPTCVSDQRCDELACPLGTACREVCEPAVFSRPARCRASCEPLAAQPGSPGLCDGPITCSASPPACPAGTIAGRTAGCYTGYCIPATVCRGDILHASPGTCEPGPAAMPAPACPAGMVAGTTESQYTGYCIPLAACGSSPLGTCDPAIGPAPPPACADGTIPGTIDGLYTGACIPAGQCPQLPCDALVTAPACAARLDCRAVDRGRSCTCDSTSCSCAFVEFDRCETGAPASSGG